MRATATGWSSTHGAHSSISCADVRLLPRMRAPATAWIRRPFERNSTAEENLRAERPWSTGCLGVAAACDVRLAEKSTVAARRARRGLMADNFDTPPPGSATLLSIRTASHWWRVLSGQRPELQSSCRHLSTLVNVEHPSKTSNGWVRRRPAHRVPSRFIAFRP